MSATGRILAPVTIREFSMQATCYPHRKRPRSPATVIEKYGTELMVRLDCSGVTFGSQLDERHLFEWAMQISGTLRWEQDTLVVKSLNLSQASLRDLVALFSRYQIPMKQLAQFKNSRNEVWFAAPQAYWYTRVFDRQ